VLSASVSTADGFSSGPPEVAISSVGLKGIELATDGEKLLALRLRPPSFHPTEIRAVLNWFKELEQKVPSRRARSSRGVASL
jgi:hypothetical protein